MTIETFFGCLFISFGPIAAFFFLTVAREPQDVIVLIASGFFWLLSLLLSAVWWLIVSPLKADLAFAMTFSVLFQEGFRYLYYRLLKRADAGFLQLSVSEDSPLRHHKLAYVAGMGFGIVQAIFSYTNVLKAAVGPGVVGFVDGSPDQYFFFHSGLIACCLTLSHTFWGVLFFHGFRSRSYQYPAIVVVLHLLASLLTLVKVPAVALAVNFVVLLISVALSYFVIGLPLSNLSALFRIR